ncbi:MAG: ATP-binding cassette domain-containing protein [Burkholderiales bacterium]|nr:ATP-binding cassette domain-containing protein [Phycisphaerae bacterium]
MTHAISLDKVRKTFAGFAAVDDLSLNVPEGSLCGFIGPNGSGKTTTLRMIMRIYAPDSGKVVVLGDTSHGPADDRVGYLPEERMLYKAMRVDEVLTYLSKLKGHTPARGEIDQWLEKLELPGVGRRRVQTLSKGQTQKIQLIAVLISKPRLVVLDEPFSGLDPVNAVVLREAILELKRLGTTVLFSTHDMSVAEKMCDSIVMIFQGRKVLDGSLQEIQSLYGSDTLRVRLGGGRAVPVIEGVESVVDFGQYQELRCVQGLDPQRVLRQLLDVGPVDLFEIARPTLQDIFVRIAAPGADAMAGAA